VTKGLRIVVADDEVEMRDFFEKVLPRFGHQVVAVAENGAQLVEYCRQLQPDLVITDVKMPELDGIEASSKICDERPVPVILVSAITIGAVAARSRYVVAISSSRSASPTAAGDCDCSASLRGGARKCGDLR
jgi:response regulator NasT